MYFLKGTLRLTLCAIAIIMLPFQTALAGDYGYGHSSHHHYDHHGYNHISYEFAKYKQAKRKKLAKKYRAKQRRHNHHHSHHSAPAHMHVGKRTCFPQYSYSYDSHGHKVKWISRLCYDDLGKPFIIPHSKKRARGGLTYFDDMNHSHGNHHH